jgi:predicted O-methyltransferase YrrM
VDTIERVRARFPGFGSLVDEVRNAGTDNLSHFGNGYTHEGGLALQQNPDEFAALTRLLVETVSLRSLYLEIGSASGGAARFLQNKLLFDRMVSIDDGGHHRYPELPENFRGLPMEHAKLNSHSTEAREFLQKSAADEKFAVVFVDGDHSESGVWQDVQLVWPFCRIGTLLILHDIVACTGVKKAWERGARERRWTPVASYIGASRPLGIGVGFCL